MSSKKQEERNEKVIRGLMKLPPNRRCFNCNSLGPQYVCTNFWTFVCVACSGIHREFTHRVKSVSMSKFTTQEVEALQRGGNQCAREMFLKDWDTQRMRLPDSSNADKIRFFIKDVYVHKKYAGGRSSDKPSRDMQNLKSHEVQKRASSYHSYSQSPPYENQYEDRRCGKQTGKRPGSDRVFCERKFSRFVYSPGQLGEQMYEDRSANGSSGSRTSDFSVSSSGDPFRSDGQSPHFQDNGYSSSCLHDNLGGDAQAHMLNKCSEMHIKRDLDGFRHPQRTASLSSFESFDSNSVSLQSVNSGSLFDIALVPEHSSGAEPVVASTFHSLSHSSASLQARSQDLFCLQPPMTCTSRSLDLLDDINNQPLSTTPTEQKTSAVPFSENHGWATFDVPHSVGPAAETNKGISAVVPPVDVAVKMNEDAVTLMHYNSQWVPFQSSAGLGLFLSSTSQQNVGLQEDRTPVDQKSSQSWNAFDDSTGNIHHDLFEDPSHDIEPRVPMQKSHTSCDPNVGLKAPENPFEDVLQKSVLEYAISGPSLPFNVVTGSSFPPSVLHVKGGSTAVPKSTNPFDIPYDSDLDPTDAFSDMSSLQAELPNPQLPTVHLGFLSQPWLNQNSASPFTPTAPQGGVAHVGMQAPSSTPGSQLPSSPTQGLVALPGWNPFA